MPRPRLPFIATAGKITSASKIVLAVNLAMFIVEAVGACFSRSVALLADSMDML
ncbi:MAG: hypothetical protein IPQ26_06385 [Elusimicrobia bacterium]|nr:hypothetical protein [Elusimicrobiota bacterium]